MSKKIAIAIIVTMSIFTAANCAENTSSASELKVETLVPLNAGNGMTVYVSPKDKKEFESCEALEKGTNNPNPTIVVSSASCAALIAKIFPGQ